MPETRNIEDARTKEIIELMDKLSELAGVASFNFSGLLSTCCILLVIALNV